MPKREAREGRCGLPEQYSDYSSQEFQRAAAAKTEALISGRSGKEVVFLGCDTI